MIGKINGEKSPLRLLDLKPGDQVHMFGMADGERYMGWSTPTFLRFTPTRAVFDNGAQFYLEIERNGYNKGDQYGHRGCSVWPLNHPSVLVEIRRQEIYKAKHETFDRARSLLARVAGWPVANKVKTLDDVDVALSDVAAQVEQTRQVVAESRALLASLTDEEKAQAGL